MLRLAESSFIARSLTSSPRALGSLVSRQEAGVPAVMRWRASARHRARDSRPNAPARDSFHYKKFIVTENGGRRAWIGHCDGSRPTKNPALGRVFHSV